MRNHDECEAAITAALARGADGHAEFLAARCDRRHGELTAPPRERTPDDRVTAARAEVAAATDETEEAT